MPNIKSAKKRVIVNQKKTEQNKNIRSEVKTAIKKIDALVKENKIEEAKALLPDVFAIIDSAASKNIIHANNAANKKARLAKKVDIAAKFVAPAPVEKKPRATKKSAVPKAAKPEVKAEPEVKVEAEVKAEPEVAAEPVKKTRKPRAKKTDAATEPKAE